MARFPSSPSLGWWRGIWNRTALYDPQNQIIKKLLHLSKVQNYVIRMLGSVLLSPDATCQFEHRPLQEQLQVCTKCDSYRCIFQLLLQLKPYLYLQAIIATMIHTFDYKEGKKMNIILQEICYSDLQNEHNGTVRVPILTAPLAPLFDNLYQGFLKFVVVYLYRKFNVDNSFLYLNQKLKLWNNS